MYDILFFIQQGFFHVLDLGNLDHILFFMVLAVVYRFKAWKKALWLITFFTLGHSITFGLSVYEYVLVNVELVEFLIPITILIPLVLNVYLALKEIDFKHNNNNIYFAFFFGLIHGMGFKNYFNILIDKGEDKFIPLVEFSLGIEFAQMVIVILILSLGHILIYSFGVKKRNWVIGLSFVVFLRIIPMLIARIP